MSILVLVFALHFAAIILMGTGSLAVAIMPIALWITFAIMIKRKGS